MIHLQVDEDRARKLLRLLLDKEITARAVRMYEGYDVHYWRDVLAKALPQEAGSGGAATSVARKP